MHASLSFAILETIVYFDLFKYPLTTLEVWKNLKVQAPYSEVWEALKNDDWLKARLENKNGMWYLRGSKATIGERQRRYRVSKRKLNRARRFASFARRIPGMCAIYACNSLGFLHAQDRSDIDLFIIAQKGKIWSVRFFCVLIAKLFFGRPSGTHTKDTICLSFFAANGADLRKVALPDGDIYYEYWLKNLAALHIKGKHHPWPLLKEEGKLIGFPYFPRRGLRGGLGKVGSVVEAVLRAIQLHLMPKQLREAANKGTGVVLIDEFLKFHDHDRREYFRDEFSRRFAQVAG